MDAREAERHLEEAEEVIPCIETTIPYAKEIQQACLDAEIPAVLGRGPSCASGGCAPKVAVLVAKEDAPRVAALFRSRWEEMAAREGAVPVAADPSAADAADDAPLPCPACGCTAPLVEGACAECGLQLG